MLESIALAALDAGCALVLWADRHPWALAALLAGLLLAAARLDSPADYRLGW